MQQGSEALKQYIPAKEAARAIGRSPSTLKDPRAWRRLGLSPRFIAGRWMFAVADIRRLQDSATGVTRERVP